jgi:hypothetical protein
MQSKRLQNRFTITIRYRFIWSKFENIKWISLFSKVQTKHKYTLLHYKSVQAPSNNYWHHISTTKIIITHISWISKVPSQNNKSPLINIYGIFRISKTIWVQIEVWLGCSWLPSHHLKIVKYLVRALFQRESGSIDSK